jgi:hypothetical protein
LWSIASRSVLLWVGSVFLILGLVLFTIGVRTSLEEHAYRTHGLSIDAVVLEKSILRADRDNPATRYQISYRFTSSAGEELTGTADVPVEEWERLEAGQTFAVTYLPGDPASSRPPGGDEWIAALVISLVGGVFTCIGAGLAFAEIRKLVQAARILRHGLVAEGTVVRTEPTATSINRVTQWQIRYRYCDHIGREQEGVSHLVSPDEAAGWKDGDQGKVRFDRNHPDVSLWVGN